MSKYLYEVSPKIPIKDVLDNGNVIRREMLLELTKDNVLHCLRHGAVSRKFLNQGIDIKVTVDNIDSLHVANYGDAAEVAPVVEVDTNVAPVVEDTTPVVETEVAPAVEDEAPTEVVETEVATDVEDTTPVVETEVAPVVEEQSKNPKNNNNNKKK